MASNMEAREPFPMFKTFKCKVETCLLNGERPFETMKNYRKHGHK